MTRYALLVAIDVNYQFGFQGRGQEHYNRDARIGGGDHVFADGADEFVGGDRLFYAAESIFVGDEPIVNELLVRDWAGAGFSFHLCGEAKSEGGGSPPPGLILLRGCKNPLDRARAATPTQVNRQSPWPPQSIS